ncbi:Fungal specific transcription factor domain-containing protein [Cladophialophora immunda]|nr:Fungal specific transcription factor domain-containing protein [Cladophialophora immunda]
MPRSALHNVEAEWTIKQKKGKTAAEQPGANLYRPEPQTWGVAPAPPRPSSPRDVVEMGILTMDEAAHLFGIYVSQMLPHRPLVAFPAETTPASLRLQKPILFLAVLAAAAGTFHEQLGMALHQQVQQAFAEHLILRAERSLELIQAILVHTNWYYSPDAFEELNFYRYLHMAATMTAELGLDGKHAAKNGHRSTEDARSEKVDKHTRDGDAHRHESEECPESIEGRRTLLASYICCARSVSLAFHRPKAFQFTPYMADSIDVLESSRHAAPTDKHLAAWAKLLSIMELSADSLRLNDPAHVDPLAESQIQLNLKNCSKQLQDWEKALSPAIKNECLCINYHYYVCLLHEGGLYADYDPTDFKPPYSIDKFRKKQLGKAAGRPGTFTSNHISSIAACLSSAHSLLDKFLSMSPRSLQFSPVIVIIRALYATFVLLKIFLSASTLNGHLHQILDPWATKLPFYLQQLTVKLVEVASLGCRLAAKFSAVATQLQEWLGAEYREDFQDPQKPQSLESIQPFDFFSLETESRRPLSHPEPGLRRNGSFVSREPPADDSDSLALRYLGVGHGPTLNAGDGMSLDASANAAQTSHGSSAPPSTDAVSALDSLLSNYWLPDWSGRDTAGSLPTFGLALPEAFDPDFNPNLTLDRDMNNAGGGGDLAAHLPPPEYLPSCAPSMNYLDNQADGVEESLLFPD